VRVRIWWQPADATGKLRARSGRCGPARRNPVSSTLEGQLPQLRPGTDDYPAVHIFVDPHPQYLAVELGKSALWPDLGLGLRGAGAGHDDLVLRIPNSGGYRPGHDRRAV
jgi:hypothetical protein